MTRSAILKILYATNVSTIHLQYTLVVRLFAYYEQVVLHSVNRTVGQITHLEYGTVGTGVEVHKRVVREGDVPGTALPAIDRSARFILLSSGIW